MLFYYAVNLITSGIQFDIFISRGAKQRQASHECGCFLL